MTWFREKADMERWEEEVDILEEELRRTRRTFLFMSVLWKQQAALLKDEPGLLSIAMKKSHIYSKMADDALLLGVNDDVICLTPM